MATPILESAFTTGEVSPALFGNTQLARMHSAAATMRNFFCGYQGGAYSRAGTAFVGFSKQTGRSVPPRLIPFQFSINQGLALEFGNFYMRVMFDGAYVTETPYEILGINNGNPVQLVLGGNSEVATVVPVNISITASYNVGDNITLAAPYLAPAVLQVTSTSVAALNLNAAGSGYAPNDTITLAGGTASTLGQVTVATTEIVTATLVSAGSGLTNGAQTATGTTGIGTKFTLNVTVAGGVVTAINSIASGGSYVLNPSNLSAEPVTVSGGGSTNPVVSITMGVGTFAINNPGVYQINSATFTQGSTSGGGSGATFNGALFGPGSVSIILAGQYSVIPANPVGQSSTTGTGTGALFTVTWQTPPVLNPSGDWLFISNLPGIPQLNNQTFIATVVGNTATLTDVYGNTINGSSFPVYAGGAIASRIFTLSTQYAEADLSWLKYTQSADVMSLCCVNQSTGKEYPPLDLARISATNWTFTTATPTPVVNPPINVSGNASGSGTTEYAYVVTAVSAVDGTESIASNIANVTGAVDIATTAGTITLTWGFSSGAGGYNVYKASAALQNSAIPLGAPYGFAGFAFGTSFIDSNIVPDFSQVPPTHQNPFARGRVTAVVPRTGGSGYTSISAVVTSTTGSGANIEPLVSGGVLIGFIILDAGSGYLPTDTVTITGNGSGATATLSVGPTSGTYPGVVAYFQERRAYAYTLNQPDTYFMSQPGSFTNFDTRDPTIDSDAITGTPWSNEVNGVQFMIPIGGALMVMTGLEAFLLTGNGGSAFTPQPLTPASQSAQNQGFNGCSATIPPIRIYQDVLYVQAKNSTYRDFKFDISNYSYTADDITQASSHLFNGYSIVAHAWCEEPYRVLWAVRNDGVLLSLTWLKSEKIAGWTRHDTFGSFVGCCQVTEPPVDALYLATQRVIGSKTAYVIERMNNRLWTNVEDAWCVDCGFQTAPNVPAATLSASSTTGLGSITGVTNLVGGTGYSAATTVSVVDNNGTGPGSGAVLIPTIVGGVITAIAATSQGSGYINPEIVISDPAGSAGGSGASAAAVLNNAATFTANAAVFPVNAVGQVIRMGGGVATITARTNAQIVTANITTPISVAYPDATGTPQVIPQASGSWTLAPQITTVGGLGPLIGATVTGLADGVKIPPQVVSASGTIALAQPASKITVGLPFQAQLQSVYIDTGEPTSQGQRKDIPEVTARIYASGPFKIGSNQVDGSTLSPPVVAPQWSGLQAAPVTTTAPYNSSTVPLCTDDIRIPVNSGTSKHGQVCVEQDDPYPLNVLAFVPAVVLGDLPSQMWPEKQQGRGR